MGNTLINPNLPKFKVFWPDFADLFCYRKQNEQVTMILNWNWRLIDEIKQN